MSDVVVEVPGDGVWPLAAATAGEDSRWTPYLFDRDLAAPCSLAGRQLRMNVVLSRISCPRSNAVTLTLTSPAQQRVRLQIRAGRYSPMTSAPVDLEWVDVGSEPVPGGTSTITLPVRWEAAALVGYPTNFMKKIDGVLTNVYHHLHCTRLRQLAQMTGVTELDEWSRVWRRYAEQWAGSDVYAEVRRANVEA